MWPAAWESYSHFTYYFAAFAHNSNNNNNIARAWHVAFRLHE